ncbi:MAG: integrase [Candidatus Eremiobacteraeota bacterium]|nr:integrase [Candidatus Eremiobacteraeota bacterium]
MSPKARREYVLDMRCRYAASAPAQRSLLLSEVVTMTGYHRKYAIALLNGEARPAKKRVRRAVYGVSVRAALIALWEAAGYPWSRRVKAMLPLWMPWLEQRTAMDSQTRTALGRISERSIDRLLQGKRGEVRRRLYGHTRPGSLLKHQIPIRAERWDAKEPGWSELDLVAHCGGDGNGEFINSLNLTDIASAWTETRALCGKSQQRTLEAIKGIRASLPFTLLGIDSDSGSEFINHHCVRYCNTEPKLAFTRSRPYKKNDNAHVEQKNWTHVRKIFGWKRLETQAVADAMNELYANDLRIFLNYFQPNVKLLEKQRIGSRVRKVYDTPQTPLDRLIALRALPAEQQAEMLAERARTNPFELAERIDRKVEAILARLFEPAKPHRAPSGPPVKAISNGSVLVRRAAHGAGMIFNGATT